MTLLLRAQELSRNIAALGDLKRRADQASVFERRASELAGPAEECRNLESGARTLASREIHPASLDAGLVRALHERVSDLRQRYAEDRNVMLDPFPAEDTRFVLMQPLRQLPGKANAAMHEAWAQWARTRLPQIDAEVLGILGEIAALRESVGRMRSLGREAEHCCSTLPKRIEDIEYFLQLCARIQQEWHNLTGEGIPQEVLTFLRAAGGTSGAAYSLLTAGVLDWLSAHGLKQALRVRMG